MDFTFTTISLFIGTAVLFLAFLIYRSVRVSGDRTVTIRGDREVTFGEITVGSDVSGETSGEVSGDRTVTAGRTIEGEIRTGREARDTEVRGVEDPPVTKEEENATQAEQTPQEEEEGEAPQEEEPLVEVLPLEKPATEQSSIPPPTVAVFDTGADPSQSTAPIIVRVIMQVFITFVGLAFGVMFIFDGCYAWLGWCAEPATEQAKNWASGLVGTVVGFWLTKA